MRATRATVSLICGIALTGCNAFTSVKNYCGKEPFVCSVAASAVVASIALTVAASSGGGKDGTLARRPAGIGRMRGSESTYPYNSSQPDRTLGEQQLVLASDSRTFEGVMAQDLLADERFKHAVHVSPKGYYTVNLSALGLEMTGDAGQYMEAGRKALDAAASAG